MGADAQGDVDVRMPGDGLDDVRRGAQLQEQADDGVPEVMQSHAGQAGAGADAVELTVEAARLDRRPTDVGNIRS